MTSKFEYVDGNKLRKKVRAIIANDKGEFLLIQPHGYKSDTWTFVGGGVESGESDEQAIVREIFEETGIYALVELHVSSARHWFRFSDQIKSTRALDYDGQIAKVFFVIVDSASVVQLQAEEIQAFCWASPVDVEELIKIPEQRGLFKEVVAQFKDHPIARHVVTSE